MEGKIYTPKQLSELEEGAWFVCYDPYGSDRDFGFDYSDSAVVIASGFENSSDARKWKLENIGDDPSKPYIAVARVKYKDEIDFLNFEKKFLPLRNSIHQELSYAEMFWLVKTNRTVELIARMMQILNEIEAEDEC